MRTTQLTQCIQKEEDEDELFQYEFDNQSEPQQNLQTPDFQATKQNEVHSQISHQAQIEQTDQYGFKSQINLKHYKDRKTLNARVEKWRQMINEFDKQNIQLIKERTRKGIPDGLRILAWPLLANIKKAKETANTIQKTSKYSDFLTKNEFILKISKQNQIYIIIINSSIRLDQTFIAHSQTILTFKIKQSFLNLQSMCSKLYLKLFQTWDIVKDQIFQLQLLLWLQMMKMPSGFSIA